ncbi:HNH endonuclease family protein [Kribbella sp. NPDC059898]|uniref:HNH endonuclease family protein n=1 Tax=Kribbella sp. NPDC059898 TaxID=3346995 RepID=UPI00364659F3
MSLPFRPAVAIAAAAAAFLTASCAALGQGTTLPGVTPPPGTTTPHRPTATTAKTTPGTTSPSTPRHTPATVTPSTATTPGTMTAWAVTVAQVNTATGQLATLPIAARGPRVKDARDLFGTAWKDVDHTGCDQRNEALARALRNTTFGDRKHCVVVSGVLDDPYSGQSIPFHRGRSLIDIDHVVPLGHAIRVGAASWSQADREAFSGDLTLELLPVSASLNRQKGDAPPDGWLPPNKTYRCAYAVRWIAIKKKWNLTVTGVERTTLTDLIAQCRPAGTR